MQFNSFIFILIFLPLTVVFYYLGNIVNGTVGKAVLLISSLLFYCYGDISVLFVLGISIAVNYLFAILISRVKKWRLLYMFVPVAVNIGLLLYYKYLNFAIININGFTGGNIPLAEILLPLGISFFTFQQIAYVVAVYREEIKNNNLLDYLVFILYFPKILMGPLTDPVDFISQLNNRELKRINWDNIAFGIKIFSLGLFKKVMIADIFAKAVNFGFGHMEETTSMDWIFIMLFYTFEIYFDFSGYSDMAVGSALLFNIKLPINFDSPYKALSIRDFWGRWHMSLTKFFTKYIYIPLGGSRKGTVFTCLNTMIVFLISGFWHGANWTFVLWGVLHGVFSVLDRIFEKQENKASAPARWICTFTIVSVLWLLFRSDSYGQWWDILKKIVSFGDLNISEGLIDVFKLPETAFFGDVLRLNGVAEYIRGFWMNVYILGAFGICLLFENNYRKLKEKSLIWMVISAIAFIWGFICLSEESVFVYFNF